MLLTVDGCSSRSARSVVPITLIPSSSASFHRPSCRYVKARLSMLISVDRHFSPSTRLHVSITITSSSFACPSVETCICQSQVTHAGQRVRMLLPKHTLPRLHHRCLQLLRL